VADNHREIQRKSRSGAEWEDRFSFWSTPPSDSEQQRIERTVREISESIRFSPKLSAMNVEVFPQGSYANRVNVRQDSDVDICCLVGRTVNFELAPGMTNEDTGLTFPSTYPYSEYKNDVEGALVARFGRAAVRREGNKAIDVNARNYLVDADVVACFEYRLYHTKGYPPHYGTALYRDDNGKLVTGFPKQHKENGQAKNTRTSRRYRQQVRIIKTLRNNMERWGIPAAHEVSSFGLESLCWNAPDSTYLSGGSHYERLISLINWADEVILNKSGSLMEVNNIKTMFGAHSDRTPAHYAEFLRSVMRVLIE
jgi:predicted nucleotidyltransferase